MEKCRKSGSHPLFGLQISKIINNPDYYPHPKHDRKEPLSGKQFIRYQKLGQKEKQKDIQDSEYQKAYKPVQPLLFSSGRHLSHPPVTSLADQDIDSQGKVQKNM